MKYFLLITALLFSSFSMAQSYFEQVLPEDEYTAFLASVQEVKDIREAYQARVMPLAPDPVSSYNGFVLVAVGDCADGDEWYWQCASAWIDASELDSHELVATCLNPEDGTCRRTTLPAGFNYYWMSVSELNPETHVLVCGLTPDSERWRGCPELTYAQAAASEPGDMLEGLNTIGILKDLSKLTLDALQIELNYNPQMGDPLAVAGENIRDAGFVTFKQIMLARAYAQNNAPDGVLTAATIAALTSYLELATIAEDR